MSNEETKRKLLQKDSFRLAKGLVLKRKRTTFAPLIQIHALFARKYLPKQSFFD